jgi:YgiT-type zinc finger domain-containing protein
MKCISCGAKTVLGTTSDVTDLQKCLIIVRNTPCHKCTECNEIIYTGDVIKRLDEIIKIVKQSMNEIAVFDYNSTAA